MAKKVTAFIKLQVAAGKANPAPPIGPALGHHGVNIPGFCKEFNELTKNDIGLVIPVVITVYSDRTFTFITKTPPVPVLIKKALNIDTASAKPNKDKVGKLTQEQLRQIATTKMPDLNAASIEAAMSMGAGTDRYSSGEGAVKAIAAGVDIILMPEDLDAAVAGLLEAIGSGELTEERIDESVLRILETKLRAGIINE